MSKGLTLRVFFLDWTNELRHTDVVIGTLADASGWVTKAHKSGFFEFEKEVFIPWAGFRAAIVLTPEEMARAKTDDAQ